MRMGGWLAVISAMLAVGLWWNYKHAHSEMHVSKPTRAPIPRDTSAGPSRMGASEELKELIQHIRATSSMENESASFDSVVDLLRKHEAKFPGDLRSYTVENGLPDSVLGAAFLIATDNEPLILSSSLSEVTPLTSMLAAHWYRSKKEYAKLELLLSEASSNHAHVELTIEMASSDEANQARSGLEGLLAPRHASTYLQKLISRDRDSMEMFKRILLDPEFAGRATLTRVYSEASLPEESADFLSGIVLSGRYPDSERAMAAAMLSGGDLKPENEEALRQLASDENTDYNLSRAVAQALGRDLLSAQEALRSTLAAIEDPGAIRTLGSALDTATRTRQRLDPNDIAAVRQAVSKLELTPEVDLVNSLIDYAEFIKNTPNK